jgi:hypothetical protein
MPGATDIDDVIKFAPFDIAQVSYLNVDSLFAQMNLWTQGLFGQAGIFPPSQDVQQNPGQRVVTNWYSAHVLAINDIEGPAPGQSGVVGTTAVIVVVERVANAVKAAVPLGHITAAQQTAVVALYNAVW